MEQVRILGIKVTPASKDPSKSYYNYYYQGEYSDYDVEHSTRLEGKPCGSEFASVDIGCHVGDIVEFKYIKGYQDKAQLVGCTVIKPAQTK